MQVSIPMGGNASPRQGNEPVDIAPQSRRSLALVMLGLMASLFVGFVDQTIVATAGPTIISELGGLSLYAWVYSAFLLTATVSMPVFGKLSDMNGRKRFFILGSIIFIGGSMLSGLSQTIYELIIFRAIQGLGVGAIAPIIFTIVGVSFPRRLVPKVQSAVFSMIGLASIVGPSLGSYLVQGVGWRWIFYVNLPIGVFSVLAIFLALKESKDSSPRKPVDWMGILTLPVWSALLILAFLDGGSTFAWYSWQEGVTFAGAAVAFVVFVLVERKAKDPIVPPDLLRIRMVASSLSVAFLRQTAFFGVIIFSPLLVQAALGGTANDGRNVLYAVSVPFVVGTLLSGQALTRGVGYRMTTFGGISTMVIGTFALTLFNSSSSIIQLMGAAGLVGLGAGLTVTPIITGIQGSVERQQIGVATSLLTFMLFLGGSIGLAILGSIQTNAFDSQLSAVGQQLPTQERNQVAVLLGNPNLVGNLLATPQALAKGVATYPVLATIVPELRNAFALSLPPVFWFVVGMLVVGLIASLFMTGSSKNQKASPSLAVS